MRSQNSLSVLFQADIFFVAETFDPDRFLDERVTKYLVANPFIFLPFNAGPRICLGQQFAYNEVSFFLVRLLQNFSSMSLDLKSQPPETLPPSSWKNCPGRKGIEEVFPKSHLTIYSYVSLSICILYCSHKHTDDTGWSVGENARIRSWIVDQL